MKNCLKRVMFVVLAMTLILCFAGCDSNNKIDEDKPTIVCTGFAQYDWVRNILGYEASNWNLIRINDKGADMHSYQPSAEDMIIISKADLLIYTGGMSEEWIEDAMESQGFQGKAYALLENGQPICMEENHGHGDDDHDHDESDIDGHHGHNHDEYDEHIWLSLENAQRFCQDIERLINEVNPSKSYKINCDNYVDKLENLDEQFEDAIWEEEQNIMIFADRFPFRYLAEDYDLTWYAAFPGCSAETEASFDTIKELTNIVTQHEPSAIFVTETGDESLAKTIINNADYKEVTILKVNSMQSVSEDEASYIEIMEENMEAIWSVLP